MPTSGTVDTLACDDPAVVQGRADVDGDGVDDTLAYVTADMHGPATGRNMSAVSMRPGRGADGWR